MQLHVWIFINKPQLNVKYSKFRTIHGIKIMSVGKYFSYTCVQITAISNLYVLNLIVSSLRCKTFASQVSKWEEWTVNPCACGRWTVRFGTWWRVESISCTLYTCLVVSASQLDYRHVCLLLITIAQSKELKKLASVVQSDYLQTSAAGFSYCRTVTQYCERVCTLTASTWNLFTVIIC